MIEWFYIPKWREYQHYTKRNPPWIKLHYTTLMSEEWVMLADASKLLAVVCMMVASRNEGRVPNKPEYIKEMAHLRSPVDFTELIRTGFLVDASKCLRLLADACTKTETETETETEEDISVVKTQHLSTEPVDLPGVEPKLGPASFLKTWNEVASSQGWSTAREMTAKRLRAFRARMNDLTFSGGWEAALSKIKDAPFCRGQGPRGWLANVDWFLRPDTVLRILEGRYDGNGKAKPLGEADGVYVGDPVTF